MMMMIAMHVPKVVLQFWGNRFSNLLTSCNSTSAEKVKPVPTVGDYDVPNLKEAAPSAFVEKVSKILSRKLFARRNKQLKANVHGFFKNPFSKKKPPTPEMLKKEEDAKAAKHPAHGQPTDI